MNQNDLYAELLNQRYLSNPNLYPENSEYEYNGIKVPRVTNIIKRCIHNEGLLGWANSLGYKHQSYKDILNNAAAIGTECHNAIDSYYNNKEVDTSNFMLEAKNAYDSFHKWLNDIKAAGNDINIILHEKTLVCRYYGGTLDGLYNINGKTYLVDYKTSNHVTYNYHLQMAAYTMMLEEPEIMDMDIDGWIILQLSKTSVAYNEFVLDFSKPEDLAYMNRCRTAFLSMLLWYYNLGDVEDEFNTAYKSPTQWNK